MRHAARQPEQEPAPERADLEAKADRVLDGHLAVQAEIRDALRFLHAAACDPQLCARIEARLSAVLIEDINSGIHAEEIRGELARFAAANAGNEVMLAALHAREQAQAAKATAPAPRRSHRRTTGAAASSGGWKQGVLTAVKVAVPAAAAGTWAAMKGSARHGAKLGLTAHTVRLAAMATTGVGVAAATAVIVLAPNVTHTPPGSAGTGAVPAVSASASPLPSSSLIAKTVTHPKPKHSAKALLAAGLPVPVYSTTSQSASSLAPSSAAPAVSVAVGPATLSVSAATLDLSLVPQATFTVTASGAGWASWHVSTSGTDLAFSPSSGVLQAGQSVTVTVSLASALDGLAQQTFSIDGQTIAVTLPLPVPVPSVVPSVVPSIVPSALPSL